MKYIKKQELKIPKRRSHSKKGDNGRVLIVGGSKDFVGALALAGLAALRSGADWVTIAAPEKSSYAINALSPDLVTKKIKGDYFAAKHVSEILKLEKRFDVVLIGNGITKKSSGFVKQYVKKTKKPLVIDADAIKVLSIKDVRDGIFTPHRGEFEEFLKNSKIKTKSALRKKLGENIIVLKGAVDEIITKSKSYYNKTGNAGLTKAGTGDVLAGLMAGFYAQNNNKLEAAKLAVYFNGLIGDILLKKKKGFTYLASDMITEIRKVIRKK